MLYIAHGKGHKYVFVLGLIVPTRSAPILQQCTTVRGNHRLVTIMGSCVMWAFKPYVIVSLVVLLSKMRRCPERGLIVPMRGLKCLAPIDPSGLPWHLLVHP